MTDRVTIRRDDGIASIAPEIYGHFAEHLGRCIYGGVWVGEEADGDDGIREDTVSLLRDLEPPVLRWPGGCFADDYHWEDGVGPREERPLEHNLWWTQGRENVPEEPNEFGTDEFLRLCERIGAEPYLAANVGTGSPDEALHWIEYCNYDGDTRYAEARRKNGREEPYGVKYWGIGNENWGCGGHYDPDDYGREYRRFAKYLRGFNRVMSDEPRLEFVGCGHTTEEWNREFLRVLVEGDAAHMLDHLSVHRYFHAGDATDFDEEEYYRLFAESLKLADDVDRTAETLAEVTPGADVGVIVDEWGAWHPEAKNDNGLEQANTVRDAVSAAGVLDLLNARADVVTMANLAQTVNVLQCVVETDEEAAWPTPTYRVFDLYRPHAGATALRTDVETDRRATDGDDPDVPLVSASASETADGTAFVTLSNRDLDARSVAVGGLGDRSVAESRVLFDGLDPSDCSTHETADRFAAEECVVDVDGDELAVELPGSSVAAIRLG